MDSSLRTVSRAQLAARIRFRLAWRRVRGTSEWPASSVNLAANRCLLQRKSASPPPEFVGRIALLAHRRDTDTDRWANLFMAAVNRAGAQYELSRHHERAKRRAG